MSWSGRSKTWIALNENAAINGLNTWLALLNANEQVHLALAAWNEIDTDAYQDRVDDADLEVSEALTELEQAQEDFDTYADLDENNPTRQRYEDALEDAQLAYDEAVAAYDQLIINRERAPGQPGAGAGGAGAGAGRL